MKIGVNLINFGPSARPDVLRGWAELSEGLGYHLLMTSDHIAVTSDVQVRYPAPLYEPLSTLGWLAGITRKISIGTTVIIMPYRSPLETARAFSNIDQLSDGRTIMGVGVGWAQQEFAALNVPYARRGAITNDYLAAIKQLWTHDIASHEGEFVKFSDVQSTPRPVQSPHPPIWIGGRSEAALRRAVLYGDAWHPLRIQLPWFRDTAIPRLTEIAAKEGLPVPDLCPRIMLRPTDQTLEEADRIMGHGTIDQIHRDLRDLDDLGCTHVLLDTYYDDVEATRDYKAAWRTFESMARDVLDLEHETLR